MPFKCLVVSALLFPASVAAQALTLTPRITAMGGYNMSFSAGVRLGIGAPGLGAFAGTALRGIAYECDVFCDRDPGLELVGGATYQRTGTGRGQPFVSAGVGVIYWPRGASPVTQERVDPLGEFEAGFVIRISTQTAVVVGGRLDAVYESNVSEVEAFMGGVGGVVIRVR
jgi:hypothetical protein